MRSRLEHDRLMCIHGYKRIKKATAINGDMTVRVSEVFEVATGELKGFGQEGSPQSSCPIRASLFGGHETPRHWETEVRFLTRV